MRGSQPRDPLETLTEALGRRPPESLAGLPPATLETLTAAVHDARAAQADALLRSLDGSLRLAPLPLRGLIKKMVT